MQGRLSKRFGCRPGEIGLIFVLSTIVFISHAAVGILEVVSIGSFPGQVKSQLEAQTGSRMRKTYKPRLPKGEQKHRMQSSLGTLDKLNFLSMEHL